jgi:hypothetical protein
MNARYGFTRLEKRQGATFETLAVNSIGYIDDQRMTLTVEVLWTRSWSLSTVNPYLPHRIWPI